MLAEIFGQTFQTYDLAIIAFLVLLEGTLSVDNALVLGLLAKRLPPEYRKRALTYGLIGAFVFRFLAIAVAAILLQYPIVKLIGGGYLLYVALKHFVFERGDHHEEKSSIKLGPDGQPIVHDDEPTPEEREEELAKRAPTVATPQDPAPGAMAHVLQTGRKYAKFWPTVFVIEMTDIAFAVDSIVAAMAFIPKHDGDGVNPKLWVVILGGFFGVVLMRFAAMIFVKMLERFPKFEIAAYLLVTIIGLKLVVDWAGNHFFATQANPHPVNFHDLHSPFFWGFWILMLLCFAYGFMGARKKQAPGFEVVK